MMGGHITIESELGTGFCFTVWSPDIEPAKHDDGDQGNGPLILVIEDNLSECSSITRDLPCFGYEFEVVRDCVLDRSPR